MSENPWESIPTPTNDEQIRAQLVDLNHPWDFFWAVDTERRPILLLTYGDGDGDQRRPPLLRDIEIESDIDPDDAKNILRLKLTNATHREIFHQFCLDIVSSTLNSRSEREAVATAVSRTWRWYRLLRGGHDGLLSIEQQRGLIGELLVIEKLLLPALTPDASIDSWKGPEGAAHDFELASTNIEVKSIGRSPAPSVRISSEFQLELGNAPGLVLAVAEVSQAQSGSSASFCITDLASRIKTILASGFPQILPTYEGKLIAAGFSWEDDYSDSQWIAGDIHLYLIDEDFPRITRENIKPGIHGVAYRLMIASCADHLMSEGALQDLLRG